MPYNLIAQANKFIPIKLVAADDLALVSAELSEMQQQWLAVTAYQAKPGQAAWLPDATGELDLVLLGRHAAFDMWDCGNLTAKLPAGTYQLLGEDISIQQYEAYLIAAGLGAYQFTRYKKSTEQTAISLLANDGVSLERVNAIVEATALVRDMVNTPAEDMTPTAIAAQAVALAEQFGAAHRVIVGDDLLTENFPAVHIVGRASCHKPCLIDFTWGDSQHKKLTLVGKGVAFDTGGLHLKTGNYMDLMKKDMGGAAHVLGLAKLIMQLNLPYRLRVIIPAVENSVSDNAYRPGDVINTRLGKTVKIGSTDAEGRLILADGLALASEEKPDMIMDFATLTGAARVALGIEIAPLFSNNDNLANDLCASGAQVADPLWRLPLFDAYNDFIKPDIADLDNSGTSRYAGAITAALFLQHFVGEGIPWAHFDVMAFNERARPGRPIGGEAMGMRAVLQYLEDAQQDE